MAAPLVDYQVMVRILATNGLGPILRQLSADVLGLGRNVDEIGRKFGQWNVGQLAVGLGAAGVGGAFLAIENTVARIGDKLVKQQQYLSAVGVTYGDMLKSTALAERLAISTPGSTPSGNLNLLGELRLSMGSLEDAMVTLELATRQQIAAKAFGITGMASDSGMASVLKALDLAGAGQKDGQFDAATMATSLTALTNFEILTKGLLKPSELLAIARQSGWTAQSMPFANWLKDNAAAFMELGARAGYGLGAISMETLGGKGSIRSIAGLQKYGLLGADGFTKDHGQAFLHPGAITGYDVLQKDGMAAWLQNVVTPQLQSMGVTSQAGIIEAIAEITNSMRSMRYAMTMTTPAGQQLAQRDKELAAEAFKQDPYAAAMQTYGANMTALKDAFEGFLEVFGAPAIPFLISQLKELTQVVLGLEEWASKNPDLARQINVTFTLAGEALVGLGLVLASQAVAGMLGPTGRLYLMAIGFASIGQAFDNFPVDILQRVVTALSIFSVTKNPAAAAGGFLWTNPFTSDPDNWSNQTPGDLVRRLFGGRSGTPPEIVNMVRANAIALGLNPDIMTNMVAAEGGPGTSAKGASGYMQLMPGVARNLGVDPLNPSQAVPAGLGLFKTLLQRYNGDYGKALAAWNWGPTNLDLDIKQHGNDWFNFAPAETRDFITKIGSGRSLAVPSQSQQTSSGPTPVYVQGIAPDAHRNLVNGVSRSQAQSLGDNPAGINLFNPNAGYMSPSTPISTSVLQQ